MRIHFIGIGGIGVSALAGFYLEKGNQVSGSDLVVSEIIEALKKAGVEIKTGQHKKENLANDVELVIYSPAVLQDNPELKKAKELGIKAQSYPETLGDLTRQYFTIAVSGAHGKSTTTSMLALVLEKAGLDSNVIVGTKIKEFGNKNYRVGKGKYLVIEADEWQASFLNYWPQIIVLTNIEREHLDYYKNLKNILKTFKEYVSHLPADGVLVVNKDDKNSGHPVSTKSTKGGHRVSTYSLKQPEAKKLKLKVPGNHNVSNALAVLAVARILKIPDKVSLKALSEFTGTWRRFDIKKGGIGNKKFIIISDYGHHPTEIKATLEAAREKFPKKKIWCVFQPHQYQRTFYLFDDFVKVFRTTLADNIVITDIYSVAGREKNAIKKKVSSQKLVRAIKKKNVIFLLKDKIRDYLNNNLKDGEVVIVMGAGDIYDLGKELEV